MPASSQDGAPRTPGQLSRELIALIEVVTSADADRDARLERKLAEIDAQLQESARMQRLITGGAAHREARLRALEQLVAEGAATSPPRPLDLPRRPQFDASAVEMWSVDPDRTP